MGCTPDSRGLFADLGLGFSQERIWVRGIADDELFLTGSVKLDQLPVVAQAEPVVEDTAACTQDRRRPQSVSKAQARSEVIVVVQMGLGFITDTETRRQPRTQPEIGLKAELSNTLTFKSASPRLTV